MKSYIILEKGWEYNDEVYYKSYSGGGHPVKVFLEKDKAESICRKMNIDFVKEKFRSSRYGSELCQYSYDIDPDVIMEIAEEHKCDSYLEKDGYDIKCSNIGALPDGFLLEVMNEFNLSSYEVVALEISDTP